MAGSLLTAKVTMELDGASKVKAEMIAEAKEGAGAAGTAAGKDFGNGFNKNSKVKIDTRGAESDLKKLSSGASSAGNKMGLLAKSALALGPAIVPLTGAAVAGTLLLGSALTAAGVGAAAMGAVALPAIDNIKDALKLAGKEGSAALNSLTPAEKNLYGATHSLNTAYQAWYKTLEPAVLPQLATGLNIVQQQIPKFTGLVKSATGGTHDFLVQLGAAANGPIAGQFVKNISKEAGPAISAFSSLLIGAGSAASQTFNYLAPLAPKVDGVIKSFGQKIATGAGSAGFTGFLDTIISDAPLAGKVVGDLGHDLGGLIQVAEPLGHLSLSALDGLLTTVQPLIPELQHLASALDQNAGAVSPVLRAYGQLAVTIAGGLIGGLTKLVDLMGANAGATQVLVTALLSLKLASKAKEAIAASSAFSALSKAFKGAAVAEAGLGAATTVSGVAGTAASAEKAAVKVGGFRGVVQAAGAKLTGFNAVGLLTTGVIGGIAAGFLSAQRETAQFNANLESQFKSASKSVSLLDPVAAQAALSITGLQKSGNYLLAGWDAIGADNSAVKQLDKLRQQAVDSTGVLTTLGKYYGVSAKQAGVFAQEAGYSGDQIASIGATLDKYNFDKLFNPFAASKDAETYNKQIKDLYGSVDSYKKSVALASDPTYNLGQAMKDLDKSVPVDNIKDLNTVLDNYSTLAIGTTASSASAGDALAQLKTSFDKNTTAAAKSSAATQTLSGDLLLAGPKTRGFAQSLAGLNAQYTANLEATFKAAGGASNLAKAGNAVVTAADKQKHALYDTLLAMGLNTNQASKLAEKYGSIPKSLKTKIDVENAGALAKTKAAADSAKNYANKNYTAHLTAEDKDAIAKSNSAKSAGKAYASGAYNAHMTAEDKDAIAKAQAAAAKARSYADGHYSARLGAVDHASTIIGGVAAAAHAIGDATVHIYAADHASGTIGSVSGELGSLNGRTATTYIDTVRRTVGSVGGLGKSRASGGWAQGPGGPTSDSFLQPTSNGEFTVNARAAQQNAALLEAINSGQFSSAGQGASNSGIAQAAPAPIVVKVMIDKREIARAVTNGQKANVNRGQV